MAPQRAHKPAAAVKVPVAPHLPQRDSQCRVRRIPFVRGLRAALPFSPGASVPSTDHPMAPACARRRNTSSSGFINWRKRSRSAASRRGCRAGASSRVAALLAREGFAFSPYCSARFAGTRVRRTFTSAAPVAGLAVVLPDWTVEPGEDVDAAAFSSLRPLSMAATFFAGDLRTALLTVSRVVVTSLFACDFVRLTVSWLTLSLAFCDFPTLAAASSVEERFVTA
jgi:hypothetical protein